jgi:hypothetical protein
VFERFTERARQVVVLAQEEARSPELKHSYIGTEHLLLGLLHEREGVAAHVLESFEITVQRVRRQLIRIVGVGEEVATTGMIPFTPRAKQTLELASQEALSLGHSYVGTEHILLALIRDHEGVAVRILLDFDADLPTIRDTVIERLASGRGAGQRPEAFARDPEDRGTDVLAVEPGWLDGLAMLLAPLEAEIRSQLKRAPDLGDLLLCLACVPHTPAAQAFDELNVDIDELQKLIERARTQAEVEQHAFTERMLETVQAKELAIEQGRLQDAAKLRDRERQLLDQARAHPRPQLAALDELRRRLGLTTPPDLASTRDD